MIVPLNPPLEGAAAQRFLALAKTLIRASRRNQDIDVRRLLQDELQWADNNSRINYQSITYKAVMLVFLDLVRLGWDVREEGYGIQLFAARRYVGGLSPTEVLREKHRTRAIFKPLVDAQLSDNAVRSFVERLETPSRKSGKFPVSLLGAEGPELHARLIDAMEKYSTIEDTFRYAIKPYLQLVTPDGTDKFTGHKLTEIWRYFRYSWSIPLFPTPGRQLLYLVRDAAHPCHAIMGLIGLNNCALQMGSEREYYLQWNLRSLSERLLSLADSPENLLTEYLWMKKQIEEALGDVESVGLVTDSEIDAPTTETVRRLKRRILEFDELRDAELRRLAMSSSAAEEPVSPAELGDYGEDYPPVSDEVLWIDEKATQNPKMHRARRHLVARKRSNLLKELLHAKLVLKRYHDNFVNPVKLPDVLKREDLKVALNTVLKTLKSRYVGANMLEISTCGAIPPYQNILGGKLAALMLFSPEIAADYQRLYSGPSIISSQIKNAPVCRNNTLVFLATTSLYAQGSSQYERVRLPAGIISSEQKNLSYRRIGLTSGYGTLQFTAETTKAVVDYLCQTDSFRDVNSIFGEGPSPKLRKLSTGLSKLGFPADLLMRHNHQRLIYAVELTPTARDYLNARKVDLPDYILCPDQFRDATERICAFWRKRWVKSRVRHVPSMASLLTATPWKLSDRIPTDDPPKSSLQGHQMSPLTSNMSSQSASDAKVSFWLEIARSGPKSTSDSLTEAELARIHIDLPIEHFILKKVRQGISIFLTGNAGDGKTHIFRKLAPQLRESGAIVVEDATALMRRENVAPILDKWREAVSLHVPFCVAINEYPLHLLRNAAKKHLPEFSNEMQRQLKTRLCYGEEQQDENAPSSLIVVDLSLRNPLNLGFAGSMLTRIVEDLHDLESCQQIPGLSHNISRLADNSVRQRILWLFERLSTMGIRSTIRELWILLARMVLGYRADLDESLNDGYQYWYSEVMFAKDPRFDLCDNLSLVDPARRSHPIWDTRLETRQTDQEDWSNGQPLPSLTVRPEREIFQALKRAFYFEHTQGSSCFQLEDPDATNFLKMVNQHSDNDSVMKSRVIKSINLAYAPVQFHGCEDNLYLWVGHRFHERPSRCFLANRKVSKERIELFCPRLPDGLQEALPEYQPDHLQISYDLENGRRATLLLDFWLYQTLCRLARGLPRKLCPERDVFRLEAFLTALHSSKSPEDRTIWSVHLEQRELLEIQVSADGKRYECISKSN